MKWLVDPLTFNYVIMTLYTLACFAHAINGTWTNAAYWFFALGITATVTFGYQR